MARDILNFTIAIVVFDFLGPLIGHFIFQGEGPTIPGAISLALVCLPAIITGWLHVKRNETSPGWGHCFKFAFLSALVTTIVGGLILVAAFAAESYFLTGSPIDGWSASWKASGLDNFKTDIWLIEAASFFTFFAIFNLLVFKITCAVTRLVKYGARKQTATMPV